MVLSCVFVLYRDQYKTEYEAKLREELELIRTRTNAEIDRLKSSTKEMYERENRSLREAREMAISERDRALTVEKEATSRYETLMQELVPVKFDVLTLSHFHDLVEYFVLHRKHFI